MRTPYLVHILAQILVRRDAEFGDMEFGDMEFGISARHRNWIDFRHRIKIDTTPTNYSLQEHQRVAWRVMRRCPRNLFRRCRRRDQNQSQDRAKIKALVHESELFGLPPPHPFRDIDDR